MYYAITANDRPLAQCHLRIDVRVLAYLATLADKDLRLNYRPRLNLRVLLNYGIRPDMHSLAHIAHDCVFGNNIIMGNSTKLAGEVIVDDRAIISAVVLVHQFTRIGGGSMTQGGTRTGSDIPPFVIAARDPVAYCGINLVGLRRRGFSRELIDNIHDCYRIIYNSNLRVVEALDRIKEEIPMSPEIQYIIDFVGSSRRGIIR